MAKVEKIQRVDIGKLVPYENNAKRHSQRQLEKLSKSIDEFGFISPVLIDKDFNIIAGHGRVEATKMSGLTSVPCVCVDGLTEAQRKAYILADNRLSEFSTWDKELVQLELEEIGELDFDMDSLEFTLPEIDLKSYYGDERERTFKSTNFDIYNPEETEGRYQMPIIKPVDYVPSKLIGFNYAKSSTEYEACIHFYLDDYQFERLWNDPQKYLSVLKKYDAIMTPNFSIYLDYPEAVKIWNTYRARLLGRYYQDNGITVIPIVYWSDERSYDYCFDGLPIGGTLSVNNIGNKTSRSRELWRLGMDELIKRKSPQRILLYGNGAKLDYDFKGIEVIEFKNEVTERMSGK